MEMTSRVSLTASCYSGRVGTDADGLAWNILCSCDSGKVNVMLSLCFRLQEQSCEHHYSAAC